MARLRAQRAAAASAAAAAAPASAAPAAAADGTAAPAAAAPAAAAKPPPAAAPGPVAATGGAAILARLRAQRAAKAASAQAPAKEIVVLYASQTGTAQVGWLMQHAMAGLARWQFCAHMQAGRAVLLPCCCAGRAAVEGADAFACGQPVGKAMPRLLLPRLQVIAKYIQAESALPCLICIVALHPSHTSSFHLQEIAKNIQAESACSATSVRPCLICPHPSYASLFICRRSPRTSRRRRSRRASRAGCAADCMK